MTGDRTVHCDATLVRAWSELTLDRNPLHVDDEYAAATPFGTTVVQGHLLAALAVDEAVRQSPAVQRISIRFTAPVPVGATLRVGRGETGEVEIVADPAATPADAVQVRVAETPGGSA